MPESVTPTIEVWTQENKQYRFLHDVEHDEAKENIVKVLDTGELVVYADADGHGPFKSVDRMPLAEAINLLGEPDISEG